MGKDEGKKLEVCYYVAASVDGFIATADGGVDWLSVVDAPGEDYGCAAFYDTVDVVVMGRGTYEKALSFGDWPYTGKPSYVLSKRPIEQAPDEVIQTGAAPAEVCKTITASGHKRAWLLGGAALAGSFRAQALITEYVVSFIPTWLGAGIPLFSSGESLEVLDVVESRTYSSGLVQIRYRRRDEDSSP